RDVVETEAAGTLHDHLILIRLVEMRTYDRGGFLFDQKGHGVQAVGCRGGFVLREGLAVLADEGGVPAVGGFPTGCGVRGDAVSGEDHGRVSFTGERRRDRFTCQPSPVRHGRGSTRKEIATVA